VLHVINKVGLVPQIHQRNEREMGLSSGTFSTMPFVVPDQYVKTLTAYRYKTVTI